MPTAVVSTIGHDRPGLVAELSTAAQVSGLNIEDSRMAVLGGEFAVLMAVSGDAQALGAYRNALDEMKDITYLYKETQGREDLPAAQPFAVQVAAIDHPGIVAGIAAFFSDRGINIRDLNTTTSPAPHTGTPIFNVSLTAEVPATMRIGELKRSFETYCEDQDLDGLIEAER